MTGLDVAVRRAADDERVSKGLDADRWPWPTFEQFAEAVEELGGAVIESDEIDRVLILLSPRLASMLRRPTRLSFDGRALLPPALVTDVMRRLYRRRHGHERPPRLACRACLATGRDVDAVTEPDGVPLCGLCNLRAVRSSTMPPAPPLVIGVCRHCRADMTEASRPSIEAQVEVFGRSIGLCLNCWGNRAVRIDLDGNVS